MKILSILLVFMLIVSVFCIIEDNNRAKQFQAETERQIPIADFQFVRKETINNNGKIVTVNVVKDVNTNNLYILYWGYNGYSMMCPILDRKE